MTARHARFARVRVRAAGLLLACTLALTARSASALTIIASWDTSIVNHPQAATIEATIQTAIQDFEARIADPVTVSVTFQRMYTGLGGSSKPLFRVPYSTYLAALRASASSVDDGVALAHLPNGSANPVTGNDSVWAVGPLVRALGLTTSPQPEQVPLVHRIVASVLSRGNVVGSPGVAGNREPAGAVATGGDAAPAAVQAGSDGTISLHLDLMNLTTGPTSATQYSLYSTTQHELDEILGSGSVLTSVTNGAAAPSGPIEPQDLFRYDSGGGRSFNSLDTTAAYFSLDGTTRLARYNQHDSGDYSDWFSWPYGAAIPAVQDAFTIQGADPVMGVEWRMLDALGWSVGPAGIWVDYNYSGPTQNGSWVSPYRTLAQGLAAVSPGGLVLLKGPATGHELLTVTKFASVQVSGGPVTIGR